MVALSAPDALQDAARTQGVWVCLAKPIELDSLLLAVDSISHHTGDQLEMATPDPRRVPVRPPPI